MTKKPFLMTAFPHTGRAFKASKAVFQSGYPHLPPPFSLSPYLFVDALAVLPFFFHQF